jgi:hypothetical protein
MDPLRSLILAIDSLYLHSLDIVEFSQDPECLLKLQLGHARHSFRRGSFVVAKGDPILGLHVWNERVPPLPPSGADLGWASQTLRRFKYSLRLAAREVQSNPHFKDICAVYGATALFSPERDSSSLHPMQRLGFFVQPFQNMLGTFGEFWENLFSYCIMWTYNPASIRHKSITGLHRTEIWMPVPEFLKRYGTVQ